MKTLKVILSIYILGFVTSCIDPGFVTTVQQKVISVRGMAYSFQENGIFPYLDKINKRELGISILPDSIENKEMAENPRVIGSKMYAREPAFRFEPVNYIDSVHVTTLYDFNENYPAMSNVNAILESLDIMGKTYPIDDLSKLKFFDHHFKFKEAATYDTIQFQITGRISGVGEFKILTNKLIVK